MRPGNKLMKGGDRKMRHEHHSVVVSRSELEGHGYTRSQAGMS